VPDGARLTTGHFLGDGVWSIQADDLDDLGIHPSPGRNRNCRISIRLRRIDKDMGDAFGIGAIYVEVDGDTEQAWVDGTEGAISPHPEEPDLEAALADFEPETEPGPEPDPKPEPEPEPEPFVAAEPAPPADAEQAEDAPDKPARRVVRISRAPAKPEPTAQATIERRVVLARAAPPADAAQPVNPFVDDAPASASAPPAEPAEDDVAALLDPWPEDEPAAASPPAPLPPPAPDLTFAPAPDPGPAFMPAPEPAFAPVPEPEPAFLPELEPVPAEPVRVVENGIVSVCVQAGLRINKFGKTGRPEDVVSVRGRGAVTPRGGGGSIVFVRDRLRGEDTSGPEEFGG
jgi:hypothetical protein